jgi:hypothetical protein
MKRPEISDRPTEGARLREDRDGIEAKIEALEKERIGLELHLAHVDDDVTKCFGHIIAERIDAISDELAALEDALDEADDTIRDVDPERGERPVTI